MTTDPPTRRAHPERIGPYRIEGRLGAGGMGIVWAARDERLDRRVAIKCLDPDRDPPPDRRERLRREARALAAVRHPAVAEVYDVVEESGALYVVMELVEGPTLGARLLSGPLEPTEAARIAGRIARALEVVHGRHLVHRDLKADNVVVGPDGRVTVLDFGVAKRVDPDRSEASLTSDGVVMGTSRAMSPEQAAGRDLDHRSDLFSLGTLLYEMLTGRHPFQGSTPLETMERVARHRPPPVGDLCADAPDTLERLVERLLEKRPSRRPADAGEVAAVLESVATSGRDGDRDRGGGPSIPRRWRLASGVAATLLLTGVAVIAAWWWSRRLPAPPASVAVVADAGSTAWRVPVTAALTRITHVAPAAAVDGCGVADAAAVGRAAAADEVVRVVEEDGCTTVERWTTDPVLRIAAATVTHDPTPAAVADAIARLYPGQGSVSPQLPDAAAGILTALDRLRARIDDAVTRTELEAAERELAPLRGREPGLVEAHLLAVDAAVRLANEWRRPDARERAVAAVAAARSIAPDDPRVEQAAFDVALATGDLDGADRILAARPAVGEAFHRWWAARIAAARGDTASAIELAGAPLPTPWQLQVSRWELELGRAAEAHDRLTAALSLAPRSRGLRTNAVVVELLQGDTTHALELVAGLGEFESLTRAAAALRLGRPDLALQAARDERLAGQPAAGWLASLSLHALGRDREAAREATNTLAAVGREPWSGWPAADVVTPSLLAVAGRRDEARASAAELTARAPYDPRVLAVAAYVAAAGHDRSAAAGLAARAVDSGLHPQWLGVVAPAGAPVR